jgi:elongation factor 2 kinase
LDLAKYHELGRFSAEGAEDEYDHEAALFHLRHAADLGILEALVAMAQIHLGLPHDILSDISRDGEDEEDLKSGFQYLLEAADLGDRNCSVRVAKALDTGFGLPPGREVDWKAAANWYGKLIALIVLWCPLGNLLKNVVSFFLITIVLRHELLPPCFLPSIIN